jgi:hypothetical protein
LPDPDRSDEVRQVGAIRFRVGHADGIHLRSLIGTDVDLVMAGALKNRYVAAQVKRDRQVLYVA